MCVFFFSTHMAFSQTGGLAHKKANCLKTYNISYYLSIYTYIQYFVPSWNFPQGPKGWPWQKSLHLSLSKYSFFVCSCPLPLVAPPLTHIILYPIVTSPKWHSFPIRNNSFTHMHFFLWTLTLHSLNMFKPH